MEQTNWEQVRIQAAIAAMQVILASPNMDRPLHSESITKTAVYFADALIERLGREEQKKTQEYSEQDELVRMCRSIKVQEQKFTLRVQNVFNRLGIDTFDKLLRCTGKFLLRERDFGKKCLEEVTEDIEDMGYKLGMLPPYWADVYGDTALRSDGFRKNLDTSSDAIAFVNQENAKIFGE